MKLRITEFHYLDGSCNNSTFQIRDGQSSSGDAFKSLCELHKRDQVTLFSSGRHLWVQFQSSNENMAGIYAVFEAVNQSKDILKK